jgi:hypothetical protein
VAVVPAAVKLAAHAGAVGRLARLFDRQGVHVGTQSYRSRSVPASQGCDEAVVGDAVGDLQSGGGQPLRQRGGRVADLESGFRVLV